MTLQKWTGVELSGRGYHISKFLVKFLVGPELLPVSRAGNWEEELDAEWERGHGVGKKEEWG